MMGLGTLINAGAILLGGLLGLLFGKLLKKNLQEILVCACGLSVIFIGGAGTLEKMFWVKDSALSATGSLMLIVSLGLGGLLGELVGIEQATERLGEWLRQKSNSSGDHSFVSGFVSASLTVCIGAMAILGPMEDTLHGNLSILLAKSVLDCVIVFAMTASHGKGPMFSVLPVIGIQGFFTLAAKLIQPLLSEIALHNLSLVGSVLIFGVGINLVFGKKIRVANYLPALVFAAVWGWVFGY